MDTIIYMLTEDSPIGYFHRNESDIVHFFHGGGALRYSLLDTEGVLTQVVLGFDVDAGEQLQLLVPSGYWKACELVRGSFALVGEAVSPAFEPSERTMASRGSLAASYPDIPPRLLALAVADAPDSGNR
jgi:hypothetical protein